MQALHGEGGVYVVRVHGLHELHGLHAVHAVHDKSGENHGESNPGVADPNNLQTTPAHDASPTVSSCGRQGDKGGNGPGFA